MPFPDSPRVVYHKNPLNQVICQLRFPPILKIDSELPADYQERIRQQYPLFTQKPIKPEMMPPDELLEALPQPIRDSLFHSNKTSYHFTSADETWTITLTRDFLALTSHHYVRWEQFKSNFTTPLEALLDIYHPVLFTRIGLRYQNVIRRSALGLRDLAWSELLQPYIAGELAESHVANNILERGQVLMIKLTEDQGLVRIQHGLVTADQEECYLIDNDFYVDEQKMEPELENVWNRLDQFKLRARRLFRWCITDKLHYAMEPTSI